MADQVTISTFLELRDNLSPGLMRASSSLSRLTSTLSAVKNSMHGVDREARSMAASFSRMRGAAISSTLISSVTRLSIGLHQAANNAYRLMVLLDRIRRRGPVAAISPASMAAAGGAGGGAARAGLFGTLVGADLVAAGIRRAASVTVDALSYSIKRGISVNKEYEKSVSAISSALYTMDISPSMAVAEKHTEKVLATLRRLAAVLPGEAADYVEVYQRTVPAALMSGMKDTQKYAEFVSKYTAVAIQRGVGAKLAATNLQIMLQGTARAGTKMAQVLSAYTGKTINDLNKMSRAARLEILQDAVEQAASGMAAAMDKFDAVYGTFRSNMEDMFRLSAAPLFADVKTALKDINDWFGKNKEAVIELGHAISESIGSALLGALEVSKELFEKVKGTTATRISQMTPEERKQRLKELEKTAQGPAARDLIPFYGLYKRFEELGEIEKIKEAIDKNIKETKKYVDANKAFKEQIAKLNIPSVAVPRGTVAQMANYVDALMEAGLFNIPGRAVKDVFAEQMTEVFGINQERTQAVWEELIKRDIVRPAVDTTPTTAPKERARTYNDFRHSNFNIKQEFAEGYDPDRIAVAFANDLSRIGDMKIAAAYVQTGGVR